MLERWLEHGMLARGPFSQRLLRVFSREPACTKWFLLFAHVSYKGVCINAERGSVVPKRACQVVNSRISIQFTMFFPKHFLKTSDFHKTPHPKMSLLPFFSFPPSAARCISQVSGDCLAELHSGRFDGAQQYRQAELDKDVGRGWEWGAVPRTMCFFFF